MGDLDITQWIREIKQGIQETTELIAPLKHLGKHEWAARLTEEVKIMREAIEALQRIGQQAGKRVGRPPKWLQTLSKTSDPNAKSVKAKRPEKRGDTET